MARASSASTNTRVDELEHANLELKRENEQLRVELEKHSLPRKKSSLWRAPLITLCVLLAVIILIIGNVLFWAGNTLINNDKYVATVQPLMADKTIQSAVADYTTNQIFNQVDVQSYVNEALPPRAEFLAPQLTTQLKGATEKTLQKSLASSRFQTLWVNTNRKAQERLIHAIKTSKTTDGVINLQDVYDRLGESLQGTKLSFLAGKTLPKKAGAITVINAPWIPKARFAVNNIGWLKPVALLLVAVFGALAIWISRNRRRMVITLGAVFAFGMACTLIVIQIAQNKLAGHVQPAYHDAAHQAAQIILQPLAHQTWAVLAVSLLIALVAWLSGPYRWAHCTATATRKYLAAPLHRLIFKRENEFTRWMSDNLQTVQWVTVAVIGLIMILVQLSFWLVVMYGAIILVAVLVAEIFAVPYSGSER